MASVEVLVGPERRRRWSIEQKQAIVAAAFEPGAVVRDVARQADVTPSLIYRWRRDLRATANSFAQVLVAPAGDGAAILPVAVIEIEFAGNAQVRIPASVSPAFGGGCRRGAGATMIPVPSGVRVWLAVGRTDMRKGMNGLALQVQQALGRDPHAGDLYVFRGARGDLIKIVWHDGIGMSLYAKRLERGRFIWPSPADGVVAISAAQLAYMLDGIDWRNPVRTWRPEVAG
jgi:transposase